MQRGRCMVKVPSERGKSNGFAKDGGGLAFQPFKRCVSWGPTLPMIHRRSRRVIKMQELLLLHAALQMRFV